MKYFCLLIFCFYSITGFTQQSDFIVLKKKNNKTLKTYYPGSFIKGKTYSGFEINGHIDNISNDTIYLTQTSVQQYASRLGVPFLDTVVYRLAIPYNSIEEFYFKKEKGFRQITIPGILTRAGFGYAILETVNVAYRGDKFSENGHLQSIAAGVAVGGAGVIWSLINKANKKAGAKYRVIYMKYSELPGTGY